MGAAKLAVMKSGGGPERSSEASRPPMKKRARRRPPWVLVETCSTMGIHQARPTTHPRQTGPITNP